MDMYQKRKMRAENKKNDEKKVLPDLPINWYIPTYGKYHSNSYK